MNTLPLLPSALTTHTIAYRNARPVSQAEFLCDVLALAARLPNTGHVFNLCKDRYWFAVSLFAAISRGILSLLPNSTAPQNVAALRDEVPDVVCLGDQTTLTFSNIPYVHVPDVGQATYSVAPVMPQIPFDQRIACMYTSGSTGKPQAHSATFWRMRKCAIVEAERMWMTTGGPCAVLGTVPSQHMFGLEATLLLPIFGGGLFSARLPFFPADVVSALAELPEPRLLVTTPFHLRKLMDADIEIPAVAAVLSATAPLALELARAVEARLGTPVVEFYGSTETGALATRRTAVQGEWETYPGIVLSQDQGVTVAAAAHFERPQVLTDVLELRSQSSFRLLGRHSDMINVVGKRSSLAFLNQLITSLPGVEDGVFCVHECDTGNDAARLVAFVVAPERGSAEILAALRLHVDPVFLPRPIVFVDSLQRDGNGKVPAAVMTALIAEHLPQGS